MSRFLSSCRVAALAAGALLACGLLLWTTRRGPGLSPDSLTYILLARNLLGRAGFQVLGEPVVRFPPGYPALLALVGATGLDSLDRVRVLHAVLFAINVVLVALASERAAGGVRSAGPLAMLLLLSSPDALAVHAMAWSEPAFLAAALGGSLLLSTYVAEGRRVALVGASVCLALALLTRYAGLALVPPMLLALRGRRAAGCGRTGDVALLGLLGLGPLLTWLAWNALASGSLTGRTLAFHPIGVGRFEQLLRTSAKLWGLGTDPAWAVMALLPLVAMLLASARLMRMRRPGAQVLNEHGPGPGPPACALLGLSVLHCLSYATFLVVSISFLDADTPLDGRMLAPAHVFGLVLVASLPAQLLWLGAGRRTAHAAAVILAVLSCARVGHVVAEAARVREEGEGFNSRYWRTSPTLAHVRTLPAATPLYSNGPEIVAFFAQRDARDLPAWASRLSLARRPAFGRELATLCADAAAQGAVIIYLEGVNWRWQLPTAPELEAACGLVPAARLADGVAYVSGAPRAPSLTDLPEAPR
jgi:hypothetical protein